MNKRILILLAGLLMASSANAQTITEYRYVHKVAGIKSPIQAPASPSGFTATVVSASQVDLSWDAAVGATGYIVVRDGVEYPTEETSLSQAGLTASTAYSFNLIAENEGGRSPAVSASATTQADCVTPTTIGQRSTQFCGQTGHDLNYVGVIGSRRVYFATWNEPGNYTWGPTNQQISGTYGTSDGRINTNFIASTSYPAAWACRSKGSGWYLPARAELDLLRYSGIYLPRALIGSYASYWSSTTESNYPSHVRNIYWHDTFWSTIYFTRNNSAYVRCARTTD